MIVSIGSSVVPLAGTGALVLTSAAASACVGVAAISFNAAEIADGLLNDGFTLIEPGSNHTVDRSVILRQQIDVVRSVRLYK